MKSFQSTLDLGVVWIKHPVILFRSHLKNIAHVQIHPPTKYGQSQKLLFLWLCLNIPKNLIATLPTFPVLENHHSSDFMIW